ncbi:hypothetical protein ABI59_09040 [Acidobacteria bacterium Mor1]|nr:hypothetical protein ABI59_09040 [Acidobacteria bacterium Mor1]
MLLRFFALLRVGVACVALGWMHRPWTVFDERIDVWLIWAEQFALFAGPAAGFVVGEGLHAEAREGERGGLRGVLCGASAVSAFGVAVLAAAGFGYGVLILATAWFGFVLGIDFGYAVWPWARGEKKRPQPEDEGEEGDVWNQVHSGR